MELKKITGKFFHSTIVLYPIPTSTDLETNGLNEYILIRSTCWWNKPIFSFSV